MVWLLELWRPHDAGFNDGWLESFCVVVSLALIVMPHFVSFLNLPVCSNFCSPFTGFGCKGSTRYKMLSFRETFEGALQA